MIFSKELDFGGFPNDKPHKLLAEGAIRPHLTSPLFSDHFKPVSFFNFSAAATMPSQPSNSGIVTDKSGERQIPESIRPDGTTRKAIKIRPGYRPPEDVEVYKNRTAETFRRGLGVIPGSEGLKENDKQEQAAGASNKNAKRREARRKAKAAGETQDATGSDSAAAPASGTAPAASGSAKVNEVDAEVEREKKARNLKKKLKQAKELKNKKDTGESLLPEQIAKVIKISELVRELDALGFDADGEPKGQSPPAATEENVTS